MEFEIEGIFGENSETHKLLRQILILGANIMGDVSKLNASVAKLSTDVDALIAAQGQRDQAAIDQAQAAVDAVDSKVVAATPAAPAPAA